MIIGHQKQLNYLEKIIESKNIPHALLFAGEEKLGKRLIAFEFIEKIFGEKLINHPDFILVSAEGKQIQIEQIRELNWRLSLKPFKAPLKAAIIDQAHLMSWEAQNCFLKTLEEPKGNAVLILVTEYPNFLLPTVLSRCQLIRFRSVAKREIMAFLKEKEISPENIEKIWEFSLGRPGLALELLENSDQLKEKEEKIKKLVKLSNSPLAIRFQYAKDLSESQNVIDTLILWLSYFRKKLISSIGDISLAKTEKILAVLQKTIFLISTTNVNTKLALEILMMEL